MSDSVYLKASAHICYINDQKKINESKSNFIVILKLLDPTDNKILCTWQNNRFDSRYRTIDIHG